MSNRWPGGIIRKTPVIPAGPFQNGAASGVWSLAEASYWTKQGLWPTAGNFLAVEDVFSTWLYTGNGGAQTITNGINVSGQGGLVWLKMRSPGSGWSSTQSHALFDTVRGDDKYLCSDLSNGQFTFPNNGITFNSSGFGIDAASYFGGSGDQSTSNFASWTFREAPNFFDVVTYTGNGVAGRQIAHNLGVAPGMIIVKRTDATDNWQVYHRSLPEGANGADSFFLNLTDTAFAYAIWGTHAQQTSTYFTNGPLDGRDINVSGATYVAYLYAHDTASTGLIQCGSYTGNGSSTGPVVNLGWEPQWLMIKRYNGGTGGWQIIDNMRGMPVGSADAILQANSANAETSADYVSPTATGFQLVSTNAAVNGSGSAYVYMAIRRGPMRTPTLGTSVFSPTAGTGSSTTVVTTGFPVDLLMARSRASSDSTFVLDRLRGISSTSSTNATWMRTDLTDAENTSASFPTFFNNTGFTRGSNFGTANMAFWSFRRAPGFFDEVCYTGNGSGAGISVNHNLGVKPELMIIKSRSSAGNWIVNQLYDGTNYRLLRLNQTTANIMNVDGSNTNATTFRALQYNQDTGVAGDNLNVSGTTYVAYLFASCPGVSKVGSYTGNGSSQTINCAFTTGARFVLIKRTDSTGDWYVWDSARGIVAGNDPYLALNSTAAEVTTNDSVDTDNTGFIVNQVAASNVNVNGATYIFLAIA